MGRGCIPLSLGGSWGAKRQLRLGRRPSLGAQPGPGGGAVGVGGQPRDGESSGQVPGCGLASLCGGWGSPRGAGAAGTTFPSRRRAARHLRLRPRRACGSERASVYFRPPPPRAEGRVCWAAGPAQPWTGSWGESDGRQREEREARRGQHQPRTTARAERAGAARGVSAGTGMGTGAARRGA